MSAHRCAPRLCLVLLTCLLGSYAYSQPVRTALDPSKFKLVETHGCLTTQNVADLSREANGPRKGSLLVLVNSGLFPDLKPSLSTYTADLARQGYQTKVRLVTANLTPLGDVFFRSFRDLKGVLREWWLSLLEDVTANKLGVLDWAGNSGVVLIGEFPVPIVHGRIGHWEDSEKGTSGCYEGCYVCDLYLTDLNGNWDAHVDQAFLPLYSTVDVSPAPDSECVPSDVNDANWIPPATDQLGKAGARPEIFLGRIASGKLSGGSRATEVQMLKEYFVRNHEYRMGKWAGTATLPFVGNVLKWPRLAWYDDDWVDYAQKVADSMNKAWPGMLGANPTGAITGDFITVWVSDTSLTCKADYMSRLQNTQWLWVDFLAHSGWDLHEIHVGDQHEILWNSELATANFKSLFYWIQGCDSSDIRKDYNLGTTYLFRNKALAVIGNTTVGPVDNGQFYTCLGWGQTIGQAFMNNERLAGKAGWQPNMARQGGLDPKRYYQWVLLGDPTLPTVPPDVPQYASLTAEGMAHSLGLLNVQLAGQSQSDFAARLGASVRRRVSADLPERATIVKGLRPGMAFLEVAKGKTVIDPQWRTYVRRGVTLDLQSNLREFKPLREAPPLPRRPMRPLLPPAR